MPYRVSGAARGYGFGVFRTWYVPKWVFRWQELRLVRKEAINFQWQATPGDLDCITSPEWCILAESVTSNFQRQTSQSSRLERVEVWTVARQCQVDAVPSACGTTPAASIESWRVWS